MEQKVEMEKEAFFCAIEGELTAALVGELREAILPMVAWAEEISIDLSAVSRIDHAGVLLMLELKLEADTRGATLQFRGYNRPVLEMLVSCNMGRFLGVPALPDVLFHQVRP
ncbi:MAG: STAS domain-containing protein [Gallionellaceae bacterium]|jgi:ABC-type transporter Mla MlaB component|nr:STAS domain-containing protein [Gallionellaceae bacterium]